MQVMFSKLASWANPYQAAWLPASDSFKTPPQDHWAHRCRLSPTRFYNQPVFKNWGRLPGCQPSGSSWLLPELCSSTCLTPRDKSRLPVTSSCLGLCLASGFPRPSPEFSCCRWVSSKSIGSRFPLLRVTRQVTSCTLAGLASLPCDLTHLASTSAQAWYNQWDTIWKIPNIRKRSAFMSQQIYTKYFPAYSSYRLVQPVDLWAGPGTLRPFPDPHYQHD